MQVRYTYDREKDIDCLLTKGKSSNNSSKATKVYERLVASKGEDPTKEATNEFIEEYLVSEKINLDIWIEKYQREWDTVFEEYQKRAETIFGITLSHNVSGFLTINNRCPYSIEGQYFYITVPSTSSVKIALHELWHFYTWYGLGEEEESRLGKEKYNEIKEALTVLLNAEFGDLLGPDVVDAGYPQHQELRAEILAFWESNKDIKALWNHFAIR